MGAQCWAGCATGGACSDPRLSAPSAPRRGTAGWPWGIHKEGSLHPRAGLRWGDGVTSREPLRAGGPRAVRGDRPAGLPREGGSPHKGELGGRATHESGRGLQAGPPGRGQPGAQHRGWQRQAVPGRREQLTRRTEGPLLPMTKLAMRMRGRGDRRWRGR